MFADGTSALAEHAAISMSPKARGLGLVNTDLTSVGTRYGDWGYDRAVCGC